MPDLQSKVLIVKPAISMLGNTRADEELTDEVLTRHQMATEAGCFVSNLYPPGFLRPIAKVAGEGRKWHKTQTIKSSFGDIIPTVMFENYRDRMNGFIARFNTAADHFQSIYDEILDGARRMHNGKFRPELYPSRETVREQFKFALFTAPMPRAKDLVVEYLMEERVTELRQQLERDVSTASKNASNQVMGRVLACVDRIIARLAEPDAIFRDSLIDNLRAVLEIAPALNIGGDADVTRLVDECRAKLLTAPETLRTVKAVRDLTAENAKNIVLRFGNVGGRRVAK